ncbi:aldo/keto reductase [Paenibacillus hexagrammi]|uniref:Aldo/keto reductase n=1 Tax=Paenibacillus hexagrammi TaxID=2908839 RepID=A0ABY3SHE8_9BACL|nr:aldo/keto reductase [Paenibacillus sp. YPD9-1]UJF32634.1 aldo/keto reductase [Paenibacillus sp. YPD9-1]
MSRTIPLNRRGIGASQLVLGCMGLGGGWTHDPLTAEHLKEAHKVVDTALSCGINMFDHADIYAYGKAETVFGQMLKERPGLRDQILIQSKCGIRPLDSSSGLPKRFDFSKEHILASVDGILNRLGTEYIDILLLHRPDPLVEPEEVAEAFAALRQAGKVKGFGVSNMSAAQMAFIQASLPEPLLVNQLELSFAKLDWLDASIHHNQKEGAAVPFPEGTLEYCQMKNVQIQAWGPLAKGIFTGASLEGQPESVKQTADLVASLASSKGVSREAVALGWLLRHPAGIQPVIGTTNPERIRASAQALSVELTRDEWYQLYVCARGRAMP